MLTCLDAIHKTSAQSEHKQVTEDTAAAALHPHTTVVAALLPSQLNTAAELFLFLQYSSRIIKPIKAQQL